jgi:hypothetical protein
LKAETNKRGRKNDEKDADCSGNHCIGGNWNETVRGIAGGSFAGGGPKGAVSLG